MSDYVPIPRQVPLLVTTTYEQVVWLDLPDDESPEEFAACWQEEPDEMFDLVSPERADNIRIAIAYAPDDFLVRCGRGFIGPLFPSGAWSRDEDDRYHEYIRRASGSRPFPIDGQRLEPGREDLMTPISSTTGPSMNRTTAGIFAAIAYVLAIVGANVASTRWGMVTVIPGTVLLVSAGTYFAGAALGLRDLVQETLGKAAFLGVLALGVGLSFWLADPFIALASAVAFGFSELVDFGIYSRLRRKGWAKAVLASNSVGAVLDTVIFLAIAPFPLTLAAVSGQFIGKVIYVTLLPIAVVKGVQALRNSRQPEPVLV